MDCMDNGKMVHEEYAYAADIITSIFIKDLRGEPPPQETCRN